MVILYVCSFLWRLVHTVHCLFLRWEVLRMVLIKTLVLWGMTPYWWVISCWYFGGATCLSLVGKNYHWALCHPRRLEALLLHLIGLFIYTDTIKAEVIVRHLLFELTLQLLRDISLWKFVVMRTCSKLLNWNADDAFEWHVPVRTVI